MSIVFENYASQSKRWPLTGRHVLAQFDAISIIVYQAYRTGIGRYAVEHQQLGGLEFSFSRMSWIKPNFLWMMYRSGWAMKENQEAVLAIRICREGFNEILRQAVPSTFDETGGISRTEWQARIRSSDVRLQWDPDHDPLGACVPRRAIQLGLRGTALESFAKEWIISIEDISEFVRQQHAILNEHGSAKISTPRENVYKMDDSQIVERLGLDK